MKKELPSDCPMKKADYEHYCISENPPIVDGKCNHHSECEKIVKDFKQMRVPTTSKVFKIFGGCS